MILTRSCTPGSRREPQLRVRLWTVVNVRLFRLLLLAVLSSVGLTQAAHATATFKTCTPAATIDMTINYGDDVSCSIDPAPSTDFFRFQGTAGEKIEITVIASYVWGPAMALYDPTGTKVGEKSSGGYAVVSSDFSLAKSGLYTIRVWDDGHDNTLTFHLFLERWYPAVTPSPIVYGQLLSGNLSRGEVVDQWAFSGAAGDAIAVQVTATQVWGPWFSLHKPNGDVLDTKYGSGYKIVRGEYTLPTTGTYLIRVGDESRDAPLDYALFLQCLGTCPVGPPPLTVNLALTGCTACRTGDTFSAKLAATNPPGKITELKVGFYLPDATTATIGYPHLELPPQFTFDGEILRGPITAAHQRGSWMLCGRVIELAVGEILAASCQAFTIVP